MEWGRRVPRIAYGLSLLVALVAVILLIRDLSNYVRSIENAQGLVFDIAHLQVIDDDNPRLIVQFTVRNNSFLSVDLERYNFELYLNGERIGSSYSQYLGTDTGIDEQAHRQATIIEQTLAPGESLTLDFTAYVYSTQMEIVRQAQSIGTMQWHADADWIVVLPHASSETNLTLQARFEEK